MRNSLYFPKLMFIIDRIENVAWMVEKDLFKFWTSFHADRWPTWFPTGRLRPLDTIKKIRLWLDNINKESGTKITKKK